MASEHFKTTIPHSEDPQTPRRKEEEQFKESKTCWISGASFGVCEASFAVCEDPFDSDTAKVRGYSSGKIRRAAHKRCKLNCKQKSSSFVPIFSHYSSGHDRHLVFEQLLTQAFNMGYERKTIPKSMENYVSVKVRCLRFLDSFRF